MGHTIHAGRVTATAPQRAALVAHVEAIASRVAARRRPSRYPPAGAPCPSCRNAGMGPWQCAGHTCARCPWPGCLCDHLRCVKGWVDGPSRDEHGYPAVRVCPRCDLARLQQAELQDPQLLTAVS